MSSPDKEQLSLFQPMQNHNDGGNHQGPTNPSGGGVPPYRRMQDASLSEEAQRRYLTYALSVVTSRALPDVRDGLKPVQRRILYTMHHELHLRHDGRYVKSARIVGDVMGKYHPHGDQAIYDAMARMAQGFSMRLPLVDGRGNFGSQDGDQPAAMRYTEAKLEKVAIELLAELDKDTVAFRPNYDGEINEPVVLPARFPHLLVNGAQGIAVGMATSIPPHNLGEVIDAAIALIETPELDNKGLLKFIKGPDFPTGGQVIATKAELAQVYEAGQGSFKLRGQYRLEEPPKGNPLIVIHSIPYGLERRVIVERIAEAILAKKLPQLLDVRDESTEDVRIVCEMKKGADPQLIMAYLYKHTPLQSNVQVNMTCLVPVAGSDQQDVITPERVTLHGMLRHFIDFRMQVVVRRLNFDLAAVRKRIHILEGFDIIFDALDEAIRIIRRSDGKADAASKLMTRFKLSEVQVDAILELKLYRLAKLEILVIRKELDEKRQQEKKLERLLGSDKLRFKLIRDELTEVRDAYSTKRSTKIASVDEPEFGAQDFIVEEDAVVLLSEQGWIKRQGSVKDLSSTRVREGDTIQDVAMGSTRSVIALFSTTGSCYVCRINDIQQTTGYGAPVQTLFKMQDGERIVKMLSFDSRILDVPAATDGAQEPEPPHVMAVTTLGLSMRLSLRAHREPSTRAGRKFIRVAEDDSVVFVDLASPEHRVACATLEGGGLTCLCSDVPVLAGAGKGVRLVLLSKPGDRVVGAQILRDKTERLVVEDDKGKTHEIGIKQENVRGAGAVSLFKRGKAVRVVVAAPSLPALASEPTSTRTP